VGPLYAGVGQDVRLVGLSVLVPILFVFFRLWRRYFYCVCLEDGLVLVPRPWILGPWPAVLVATTTAFAWLPYVLLTEANPAHRHPWAHTASLIAVCGGAIGCAVLLVYRLVGDSTFRKRLSRAPLPEIPGSDGPAHVDLSTVRSLKTNAWRLLLVREGEEDLTLRIPFLEHGDVEWALKKAYPGLWRRDS
jgi:hypothetical protein